MVHHNHHHDASGELAKGDIPNVANEAAVIQALDTNRAVQEPDYVKKVIESYVDNKRKQDQSDEDVVRKLQYIQQRFPHYTRVIDEVTNELGLQKVQAPRVNVQ